MLLQLLFAFVVVAVIYLDLLWIFALRQFHLFNSLIVCDCLIAVLLGVW